MGDHETYGKQVLRSAAGLAYHDLGSDVCIDYGTSAPARIDRAVGPIAIEIESRTSKQTRGAVLENPWDPGDAGVPNMRASLRRVLATGQPDYMEFDRHDIEIPGRPGQFARRY